MAINFVLSVGTVKGLCILNLTVDNVYVVIVFCLHNRQKYIIMQGNAVEIPVIV